MVGPPIRLCIGIMYVCVCVREGESEGGWLTTQVLEDQVEFVVGLECIVETYNGRVLR